MSADWNPIQYEIKFDKNAENAAGQMENVAAAYDAETALPLNGFTYEDHSFAGWASTPDGPVIYTDGQKVKNLVSENKGTVTLYAVWNENGDFVYSVEHYKQNPDGSWPEQASEKETGSGKENTTVNAQPKNYDGFVFDASVEGSMTGGNIQPDGSLVLKLYYKILHTVSFDADGGE